MKITKILATAILMTSGLHLNAQNAEVEYTSELQSNYRNFNFVNLLRLDAVIPLNSSIAINAATISIAKTSENRLIEDLQTFSNIEEDNLPLALAVCGINWKIDGQNTLFAGLNNMNEDYFTSTVTSFFTNSSCGVFPTISANYPIANYPMASIGVHYSHEKDLLKFQASLFNGTGHNRLIGRENVFRFCPKDDGLFGIAQAEYHYMGNDYFVGICGRYYLDDNFNTSSLGTAFWAYTEQNPTDRLSFIISYSHAFVAPECSDFAGIGGKYTFKNWELGLFADMARFEKTTEYAVEITGRMSLNTHLYIQPTVHAIITGHNFHAVGMLRINMKL